MIRTEHKPVCPDCGGSVVVRDSRKRLVKDSSGQEYPFKLRRLYCPVCRQIHLEIPDCIEPNKHYFRATIAGVRSGEIEFCAADNKTIYLWKND